MRNNARFLLSACTGLGNFVLKTPMIRAVKELWPDSCLDLITDNSYGVESVLGTGHYVDRIHVVDAPSSLPAKLRLTWGLRRQYDVLFLPFDACPTFLWALGPLLARDVYTHVNLRKPKPFLLGRVLGDILLGARRQHYVPFLQGRHEIDLNLDLVEACYNRPMERSYETFVNLPSERQVLEESGLQAGAYIVLQPAARNGEPTPKIWPPERFANLIDEIHRRYPDRQVVLVGDTGDAEYLRKTELSKAPGVICTVGRTSIDQLKVLIAHAAVAVVHDSGTMHIANAVGVKLVALMGPTDYTRTRPLGKNSTILFSHGPAFGAMYNFGISETQLARTTPPFSAMDGITVEQVMSAIDAALRQETPPPPVSQPSALEHGAA